MLACWNQHAYTSRLQRENQCFPPHLPFCVKILRFENIFPEKLAKEKNSINSPVPESFARALNFWIDKIDFETFVNYIVFCISDVISISKAWKWSVFVFTSSRLHLHSHLHRFSRKRSAGVLRSCLGHSQTKLMFRDPELSMGAFHFHNQTGTDRCKL